MLCMQEDGGLERSRLRAYVVKVNGRFGNRLKCIKPHLNDPSPTCTSCCGKAEIRTSTGGTGCSVLFLTHP